MPIILPCHRVIGANGALTGYIGGLERKRALLDLEARARAGRSPDALTYRDLELGGALLAPECLPLAAARRHVLLSRPYSTSNHA